MDILLGRVVNVLVWVTLVGSIRSANTSKRGPADMLDPPQGQHEIVYASFLPLMDSSFSGKFSQLAYEASKKLNLAVELPKRKLRLRLEVEKNRNVIAPHFKVEHRYGDAYSSVLADDTQQDCFYIGRVLEDFGSHVSLDLCDGLRGVISCSIGSFMISPLNHSLIVGQRMPHILQVLAGKNNSTERHGSCPVKGHCEMTPPLSEAEGSDVKIAQHNYELRVNGEGGLSAVQKSSRWRRSISERRFIETMVVADQEMYEFYGRQEVELRRYLLSVMSMVTSIMKDSSVGNYVDVAVVKLVILKKNPVDLAVSGDAAKALKSFCRWQKRHNKHQDENPEHYDTAILVTRKDLCSSSFKCDTLGLAELGTICDPVRSCSIVEDNGLSVAFTIAHEIGHLLAAPHDGDDNECTQSHSKVHIMTPLFSVKAKTWTWSTCSRSAMTDFLESNAASCLLDKPSPKFEHPLPKKLPGELFSMEEQCKLVYGKASTFCPFIKQCDRIWCVKNVRGRQTCHTNNMPWAEGTRCGHKKWCIHGKCVPRTVLQPVNGGWGSWGEFQSCSRSCGGGITFAIRECDNPRPLYGGTYCVGPRRKYKSCNTKDCPRNSTSFRALQCAAFNGKDVGIPGVPATTKWKPKFVSVNSADSCKLFCEVEGYDGIFYELAAKVVDGTKCKLGSNDICVDGQCRIAGCDNVLNSEAKLDNCGICNGDNSTCRKYSGHLNSTKEGYNFVVFVPRGASQLKVVQYSPKRGHDTTFLALLNQSRKYIFNGQWRVSSGKRRYHTGGTDVFYSGIHAANETIWIPGTLKKAVEIRVLSLGADPSVNIEYSYNFPVRGKQLYGWEINEVWSECFPICQGQQIKEYECRRGIDSQKVSEKKCHGKKPSAKVRKCNRDCQLKWTVYKSECKPLKRCGAGIIQQTVTCVMKTASQEEKLMHFRDCHKAGVGRRPKSEVACYSPCSPVVWKYTPWTECDQTCGGGIRLRSATCVDQQTNATLQVNDCDIKLRGPLQQPCSSDPCPKWHSDAWSGVCSVTCGRGVVERNVYCMLGGKTVPESTCEQGSKPSSTQPCELSSCAAWKVRAWSKCSRPCGMGYQIRQVYCETGLGELVPDSECTQLSRPSERKKCFLKPCQLKAKLVQGSEHEGYRASRWLVGSWTECSSSCGGGRRTRSVACLLESIVVNDRHCGGAQKPADRIICNAFPCPFWRHGQWSECTKLCGGGIMTRLVACGYNGSLVDETFCLSTEKPMDLKRCNVEPCLPSQHSPRRELASSKNFHISEWTTCSVSCGVGVRTRNVTCAKDSSICALTSKPVAVLACNAGPCPGWNYGQWAPCFSEKKCGQGWQARLVVCQLDNGTVLENAACNSQFKPARNRSCHLPACPDDARWIKTPWQPCNVACGRGIQFRYVSCEDVDGVNLPEKRCQAISRKPAEQKVCVRKPCPHWIADKWEQCDYSSCTQQRSITCWLGNELADETVCDISSRPVEQRPCDDANCVKEAVFMWKVGQWSKCATTCGYSQRERTVSCIDELNVESNIQNCVDLGGPQPLGLEQCFAGPCPSRWVAEAWSECSTSCNPGVETRNVYCDNGQDKLQLFPNYEPSDCLPENKPIVVQECNLGTCGDSYRWQMTEWSQCTKPCGIGKTHRDVYCVDSQNVTQHDHLCPENRPGNYKACNTKPCPARSCSDVQRGSSSARDGEYQLLTNADVVINVYCEGMSRNNPKEFITLKADPKDNYSEIYGKRLRKWNVCPNQGRRLAKCDNCIDYAASGLTFFRKVRLDIRRMVLVPEDKTFSDKFGMNPPGFASAGDCYSSAKCPQGRFMVNLQGTGLQLADNVTWTSRGYTTSHRIRVMQERQVVYGKCGGYCGMCAPSYKGGLKVQPMQSR